MTKDNFSKLMRKFVAINILILLGKNGKKHWQSSISRELDITYSHTNKTLEFLNKANLIKGERIDRRIIITLTPKGEKVAEKLIKLEDLLR
jgi:DNA-binding MarR family transcriptional regulator